MIPDNLQIESSVSKFTIYLLGMTDTNPSAKCTLKGQLNYSRTLTPELKEYGDTAVAKNNQSNDEDIFLGFGWAGTHWARGKAGLATFWYMPRKHLGLLPKV